MRQVPVTGRLNLPGPVTAEAKQVKRDINTKPLNTHNTVNSIAVQISCRDTEYKRNDRIKTLCYNTFMG